MLYSRSTLISEYAVILLLVMSLDWIRKLAAAATRAPSADNSQPWTLQWNGTDLSVAFAPRNVTHNLFPAGSHATLLSVGAVVEQVHAVLTKNAMPADWQFSSDLLAGQPYATIALHDIPANFVLPDGVLQRHTSRLAFRSDALPAGLLDGIESNRENSSRLSLLVDGGEKSRLVRLVRLCSEARFCNRELHEWLISSLRFTPEEVERGDGLDVQTLGLPPGGKQFLRFISDWSRLNAFNQLGAYKLLAYSEVTLLTEAPAILCIVGQADARSVIEAGRLMNLVWTDLNLQGIAVHPYYVVTDQIIRMQKRIVAPGFEAKIADAEEEIRDLLTLQSGEMLHMILRIGYPKSNPVRSRRIPVEVLLEDISQASPKLA